MELTFEEFKKDFLEDVHIESQIAGTTYDDYFFTDMLNKLVSMGEITDPIPICVNKKGRNNRRNNRRWESE